MSNLFATTPLPGRFDKVEKADLTGVQSLALRADSRERELVRRFERAENFKRQDLNASANFDIAGIGQFGQEIFQQEVDEVRQMIVSGDLDPVQARAKIGELKSLHAQFKGHADAMKDKDKEALGLIDSPEKRAAYEKRMGIGETLSYDADDYAVQHNLALNGVFQKGSAQKVNGKWTVIDPNTGQRVPFSQVTGFADPTHFYRYGTKAVDVGNLNDWAKSKATASAIGFKDGKWDESRARGIYRDGILTTDDTGKTHRLQLLGTLEDRGLIGHLTDEQKRAFRDGEYTVQTTEEGQQIIVDANGNRLAAFEEVIAKGEDEFVARSQFDTVLSEKNKKDSDQDDDTDFVVGGLSVPQSGSAELASLNDPQMKDYIAAGGEMGHTLNRFETSKAPTIVGSYVVPNHPNTKKVTIIAAGVNELGKRVAMVIGEEAVETPSSFGPDFPPTTTKTQFEREVLIGDDMDGLSRDVFQELKQKHPKMFRQMEADRNARIGLRVENQTPEKPKQEEKIDISDAQQKQIDRYNSLKERRDKIVDDLANSLGLTRDEGESEDDFILRIKNARERTPDPVQLGGGPILPGSSVIGGRGKSKDSLRGIEEEINTLLNDRALGPIIKQLEGGETAAPDEGIQQSNEDPFKNIEDMAKESNQVIANAPDDIKDKITAKINAALPDKIYAFETENSMGEKAIDFRDQSGMELGDLIFFT